LSWCTENLTPERRRDIAEGLIQGSGIGKVANWDHQRGEMICRCPLHEEKNPSFAYNYRKDAYHCSSEQTSGDLIKLFCELKGLDSKAGFKAFIAQYAPHLAKGGGKGGRVKKPKPKSKPKAQPAKVGPFMDEAKWSELPGLSEALITQLVHDRGWSREVIQRLGLKLIYTGNTARVAIPVRDESGRLLNIRKYSPGPADNKVLNEKGFGKVRLLRGEAVNKEAK
jgi:hypothetical protein